MKNKENIFVLRKNPLKKDLEMIETSKGFVKKKENSSLENRYDKIDQMFKFKNKTNLQSQSV